MTDLEFELEQCRDALGEARVALGDDDRPFLCDAIRELRAKVTNLRASTQAGLILFEYMGELLNAQDLAADEAPENLQRIGELVELVRGQLTRAEKILSVEEAHTMLGILAPTDSTQER